MIMETAEQVGTLAVKTQMKCHKKSAFHQGLYIDTICWDLNDHQKKKYNCICKL